MPRQPRIEFKGALYHVMARGNRMAPIVADDLDRARFVETLGEACGRAAWEVYAWVLMDNHYHLALRTPAGNLVEGMKWFQNAYTRRFNSRHREWGRLYGERYKSILVEGDDRSGSTDYLSTLIDYIHLNPVRAGLVRRPRSGQLVDLLDYKWSSLATAYGVPPSKRAGWMNVRHGLEFFGAADTARGRRRFIERLQERAANEAAERCGLAQVDGAGLQSSLRRGWYWGSQGFRERLEGKIPKMRNRTYRSSAMGRDGGLRDAGKVLAEAGSHFGLRDAEMSQLPRGDLRRAAIGWALRRRSCVSMAWIAERLNLKSAANASQQIRRFAGLEAKQLSRQLRQWRRQILKDVD